MMLLYIAVSVRTAMLDFITCKTVMISKPLVVGCKNFGITDFIIGASEIDTNDPTV